MEFFKSLFGPEPRRSLDRALRGDRGRGRARESVEGWTAAGAGARMDGHARRIPGPGHGREGARLCDAYAPARTRFPTPPGFGFRSADRRSSATSERFFGMQDIQVGHPEFDATFVIKGNDELARAAAVRQRTVAWACHGAAQVSVERPGRRWMAAERSTASHRCPGLQCGTIGSAEVERLKGLYDVFAETLHELSQMGVAGSGTGGVSL